MDPNRFTTKSAEALQGAMQLAGRMSHQAVTPWHLLMALIDQRGGLVANLLQKLEKSLEDISSKLKSELEKLPRAVASNASGQGGARGYATPEFKQVLDQAENEAGKMHGILKAQ